MLLFCCVVQVYTRSVIDPIPAPSTCLDGEAASKAADRQKKKGKMSDEEIMDKLSKLFIRDSFESQLYTNYIYLLCPLHV